MSYPISTIAGLDDSGELAAAADAVRVAPLVRAALFAVGVVIFSSNSVRKMSLGKKLVAGAAAGFVAVRLTDAAIAYDGRRKMQNFHRDAPQDADSIPITGSP